MGPTTEIAKWIHAWKYRGAGESFVEFRNRLASALQDSPSHFRQLQGIFGEQRFLPAGRIQSAMGSARQTTPYNCFVADTIDDDMQSILDVFGQSVMTMREGGGVGYDFSNLRPAGDRIRSLDSQASGPVSFMGIFDEGCKTIASAGHRRGAQMGVLRVDHPDIERYIRAKQNSTDLTAFNISVAITDEFMEAVKAGDDFQLKFEGKGAGKVYAPALWETIMRSTWEWAEPGVLFIDRINDMNNLKYCETIAATNPCGEQPLPPNGACLLGSFNLTKYATYTGEPMDEGAQRYSIDLTQLESDIPYVVRAMDNVIDRARYPLEAQEVEALSKRRMGLGITGMSNMFEAMGYPYGEHQFLQKQNQVMRLITHGCYRASIELAKEKGPFPLFDRDEYLESPFIKTLPEDIQQGIYDHGIRNSHLTSIAPTGTISLAADNVSSGIEPVFSHSYKRTIQTEAGAKVVDVEDYGARVFQHKGKTCDKVTAKEHLNVLLVAQKFTDSACSKTCNVSPDMPWDDFKELYMMAWEGGAKGCTTFNPGGKRFGVLNTTDAEADTDEEDATGLACYINPETGERSCE